ncbi:MAG TPA: dephospho-CoA kinase [Planctomycetota bacterium]|nr:dephospho-CoA kinase [Planctomycetota bacterium]
MPTDPDAGGRATAAFRPRKPVVIGILGGIAAGKSAVAGMFAAHGLVLLDADEEARLVAAEPDVQREVAAAFGPDVLAEGGLDRRALAALVFGDARARQRLEAIMHPRIRARLLARLDQAKANGDSVLLDVPLLLEGGLIACCDEVVFVDAAPAVRAARARERGWQQGELEQRQAAQAPLHEKRARASHCIQNDGDFDETRRQVAALLREWTTRTP